MRQLIYVLLLVLIPSVSFANPVQISLNGRAKELFIEPGQRDVTVYARTKGNISSIIELNLSAPKGATVKASLAPLTGDPEVQLRKQSNFSLVELKTEPQLRTQQNSCVSFSPGEAFNEENERTSRDSPICHMLPGQMFTDIQAQLETTLGGGWSFGEVCGYLIDNVFGGIEICDPTIDEACRELLLEYIGMALPTPTPAPLPAKVAFFRTLTGTLIRDACGAKTARQLLKITISYKAPRTSLTRLRLSALETKYTGDMASTIKPVSEGKFAPQPLLLMTYLTMCGQEVRMSKFHNGREKSFTKLKVEDLIPYNGRVLNRTPVGSLLRGGARATFTLSDGQSAYGVCFALTAQRQKVNGY